MARIGASAYLRGMKRKLVSVFGAALGTAFLAAMAGALWLSHDQSHYSIVIAPLGVVAWAWWSVIRRTRERRSARGS